MIRFDGIKHYFDANETLFLQRQLESIEAKLYEFKQRELKYRQYIPVDNSDSPGAETVTYRMLTQVGMAKIISNYSRDLPRADAYLSEFSQKVKTLGIAFGYTTQDIRAAQLAGTDLPGIYVTTARRGMRELESKIAWLGDEEFGMNGFLTNENIPTQAATKDWDTPATVAEILGDIGNACSKVRTQSKGIHQVDTALFPIPQYELMAKTRIDATISTTILEWITKPGNPYGLKIVDWLSEELELAFTGGTEDGAVFYEKNPEVLQQKIPMEMITHPMQQVGLEFQVPCEARNAGVIVRYPLGCCFLTGI